MAAYYNECDPYNVLWLRALINAGLIADGDVDSRSIVDVSADDLNGYDQCHFFAGIGGWSYALRLAQWPDDQEVWTGSCPCQPFSTANAQAEGLIDDRHLWPAFRALITQRRPGVVFGEQVPNAANQGWLDIVFDDLEAENYSCGALILRASMFGASHRRRRLYFVADTSNPRLEGYSPVQQAVPRPTSSQKFVFSDTFTQARRVLAGDYGSLLLSHGVSFLLEQSAIKGYGNAIVPQVAAAFIEAYIDSR